MRYSTRKNDFLGNFIKISEKIVSLLAIEEL